MIVGARATLFGEPAVRIKRPIDGALVIEHQVRVVPLPTELQRGIVMSGKFRIVVMGVNRRRSALEIHARTLFKKSGHAETVDVAVLGAESAFARNIREGVASAKRGRDRDVDCVVARGFGMHPSPPGPFRIEVKMAAHKERPRGKDCVHGKWESEGQHREQRQFEQQVSALARGMVWSSGKILGFFHWGGFSGGKSTGAGRNTSQEPTM